MAGTFRIGIQYDAHIRRLFQAREWNNAARAAMRHAGNIFIHDRLPVRFGQFAITALHYNAKKLRKEKDLATEVRMAIAMMRKDGSYARLVATYCARWGGWDPNAKGGPKDHIWKAWVKDALKSGKVKVSKSGDWLTARKKMREEVLRESRIRERVKTYAMDEYVDQGKTSSEQIPLVNSGWLRENIHILARTETAATAKTQTLRIPIPRGDRVNRWVNQVLQNYTQAEALKVAADVRAAMEAFVDGAHFQYQKRGQKNLKGAKFSDEHRAQFDESRTNAHKQRTAAAHRSRTAGDHQPRS